MFLLCYDCVKTVQEVADVSKEATTFSAVRLFLRQSIISRKLPFQPVAQEEDGFYGKANLKRLRSAIAQLKRGEGQVHELIEP